MNIHEISVHFFLQLAIILGAVRIAGAIARRLGQPRVVGEMLVGIVLGPSLLGRLFPHWQAWLLPAASKPVIYTLSQLGIVLYMFVVGLEFQSRQVRRRLGSAISISFSGIVTPFVLGGLLAVLLARDGRLFSASIARWQAMMFMGAAMAITAFPMLARIIHERGLSGSNLGTLTLAAGAIDDAAAWCLLAIVLAGLSGNPTIAWMAIGGGAAYALALYLIGRPALRWLEREAIKHGRVTGPMLGIVLMLLMLAAWFTDAIRIYAVFGAFLLGAAMPRGIVSRDLQRLLEPIATNFLVPLFFVYSGLNTQLGLVNEATFMWYAIVVTLVACAGKGLGCGLAAWLNGESGRDALGIGVLMNARGMMELILLNLALERGIITPVMFAVMVVMALATTWMTTPLFTLISNKSVKDAKDVAWLPFSVIPLRARRP